VQHLVRRDVVQHEADGLCGAQPGRHRDQLPLRQADELRIRAGDRQCGNYVARFDSRDTVTEPIHYADQVPARREGHWGSFGLSGAFFVGGLSSGLVGGRPLCCTLPSGEVGSAAGAYWIGVISLTGAAGGRRIGGQSQQNLFAQLRLEVELCSHIICYWVG
jgi:hypothetical protein